MMDVLGVSQPVAIGMATLVFLIVAGATHNAFCKMTDAEVLAKVESECGETSAAEN